MDGKRIVIVGGGVAGVMAAEAARKSDANAAITLIHDEPGLPYNRLNLTRMIAGELSPDEMELKKAEWYSDKAVAQIHGKVIGVHRDRKEVSLDNGQTVGYDALVLATGADAFVPPIPGADLPGVTTLRTLTQAREIMSKVGKGARCVCIGGGLLGLELAAGLAKRGASVTVLEGAETLLPRQLAPPAAAHLGRAMGALGLSVRCGVRVSGIESNGGLRVNQEGGEPLDADIVLISAGVRPNVSLAKSCGLDVGRGLKVDDAMRTSDTSIFAAGDVTEHQGITYGLWPIAMEQGRVAGANAAGGYAEFKGSAPSAFLKVVGVDVFSIGRFMPGEGDAMFEDDRKGRYARLVLRDGLVVGANLVGDTESALTVKAAIEKGIPVGTNQRLLAFFPSLGK